MLDPGFFRNPHLAELPPLASILFAGLWCRSDRQGRSLGEPRAVLGDVFLYRKDIDEAEVVRLLDLLEHSPGGFIRRYEAAGRTVLWIPTFHRFQRPHPREKASILPRHPDDDTPEFAPKKRKASRGTVLGSTSGEPSARPRPAKGCRNTELLLTSPSSSPTEKKPGEAAPLNGHAPGKAPARNWLSDFLDDWLAIRGGKMVRTEAAGKVLKEVRERYGHDRAREGWRRYLTDRRDKEAAPHWFAQDAARWCGGPAPLPAELLGDTDGKPSTRGWLRPLDWQDGLPAYSWPCTCDARQHSGYDKALRGTCPVALGHRVDRNGCVVA